MNLGGVAVFVDLVVDGRSHGCFSISKTFALIPVAQSLDLSFGSFAIFVFFPCFFYDI